MQRGADATAAPAVNETQLGQVGEQRIVQRLLRPFERVLHRQPMQIDLTARVTLPGFCARSLRPTLCRYLLWRRPPIRSSLGDIGCRNDHGSPRNLHQQAAVVPHFTHDSPPERGLHHIADAGIWVTTHFSAILACLWRRRQGHDT